MFDTATLPEVRAEVDARMAELNRVLDLSSMVPAQLSTLQEQMHLQLSAKGITTPMPSLRHDVGKGIVGYCISKNYIAIDAVAAVGYMNRAVPFDHTLAFIYLHELGHWHDQMVQGNNPHRDGLLRNFAMMLGELAYDDESRHRAELAYAALPTEAAADKFALDHMNAMFGTNYTSRFELLAV